MITTRIYDEIREERVKQDAKWGGPENDDKYNSHHWIAFITKHAGRAVVRPWNLVEFRRQMIRVAALAVAAVEWCDRNYEAHEIQNEALEDAGWGDKDA